MQKLVLLLGVAFACHIGVQASPKTPHFGRDDDDFYYYSKTITGTVKDSKGQPLSGATVAVKGATQTTITNATGSFQLTVDDNATTLVVSYVGSETQEIAIGNSTNVQVQLAAADNIVSDVVVVGYGTQRRVNVTGSVATVTAATLTQRPAPNAANLLQGRVTGLQVTQPSGEPGRDNPILLIRGRSTFSGTSPLVLIDGVTGSLNNISPDDIENISVLKDAASAAIYGSRSANGVIIVTTKKGRKGQTTVSYRPNVSTYTPTALPDLITNSAEYMEMYNAAAARGGIAFRYSQADIDKYRNSNGNPQYPNFNTIDHYFATSTTTNHNLSLSGGGDRSTFNISMSYLNQKAMLPGYSFKRYNGLLNYTSQVSKAITVGTTMVFTYKDRQEPPFTSENMALLVYASGPLYGPFLPDGSGRIVSRAYEQEGRNRNPQEALAMGWQNTKEYNLNAQAYIDIKLFKGLTWTSKAAINYVDEYYKMYQHPYSAYLLQERDATTGDYKASSFGPDYLGVTDQYSKTLNPTIYSVLNYETTIASNHSIKALVGYEQLYNKFQTLRGRRFNGASTALTELAGYTSTGEAINATYPRLPGLTAPFEWALQSVFGRINYAFKGKYLLEGNARYDGTSRVSPGFRWGWFPSVSAGWLVSKESFVSDHLRWISELKLRASYGTLGNQDIGNYAYQNVLTVSGISYPFGNTTPAQGAVLNSFKDQSIKWESTQNTDFGIDMEIKRGLFGFTFDWFNRKNSSILYAPPVPASLGLTAPVINNGSIQAWGIELEIRHQYSFGKFSYGVNAQISTAKNKVLDIKVPTIGSSIRQVGLPLDAHYLYVWDGIFQESDIGNPKVPRHVLNPNPKPGDLKMKDLNGDGVVDANDRQVVKGAYPDYIYSFGFNAAFKGFSLNAFFQGVEGLKNRVNNWGVDPFMQGTAPTTKWRNAWTPQNPTNSLPAIYIAGYTGVANYAASTYYLMDASYLRLKNVVLSYTFPRVVFSRIKAKDLSIYVSADNLITFTKYEGSDPERSSTTGNFVQYPQARILNFGMNIKF